MTNLAYVAITPARNESENLPRLAETLLRQTHRPAQWIIVDDASTDDTRAVAEELARQHDWISYAASPASANEDEFWHGRRGGRDVVAFHTGLDLIMSPPGFVMKLDADVSFADSYMQDIVDRFCDDPELGIASGDCLEFVDGAWCVQYVTGAHVRGATRVYRWECAQAVMPLEVRVGWDGVDETKARLAGWKATSFTDLQFLHHRRVGERDGGRRFAWAEGETAHFLGYRPSYVFVRMLWRMRHDVSAPWMLIAYATCAIRREAQCDAAVRRELRQKQRFRSLHVRASEAAGRPDTTAAKIKRRANLATGTNLLKVAGRDLTRVRLGKAPRSPYSEERPDAIDAGLRWLCRTHDATGRRGSSVSYSLLRGWGLAFPETTGYIIGTLLAGFRRNGDPQLEQRAIEMGEWEIETQNPDGGVVQGVLGDAPRASTVFNTGMVLHGWLDLDEHLGTTDFLLAAERAGDYLVRTQDDDGAWRGDCEYFRVPHTYNSRVSWALLRLAAATNDDRYRITAERQLDWVLQMRQDNGWFDSCAFKPGMLPSTHSIAYTLRGLLEATAAGSKPIYLERAAATSRTLLDLLHTLRWLPATYDSSWRPRAHYECLTGVAQLAGVWLRLFELTGEQAFHHGALQAIDRAAAAQERGSRPEIDGALAGSNPIWGRYAPLQYPNWATKFLTDTLMLRDAVSASSRTNGRSVSPSHVGAAAERRAE